VRKIRNLQFVIFMKFSKFILLPMAFALAGCSAFGQGSPTPLPTVSLDGAAPVATRAAQNSVSLGGVTASGVVVSASQAELAAPQGQRVSAVKVAAGDKVTPNQPLVVLDDALAAAQVAQAKAALLVAQATLDAQKRDAETAVLVATTNYSRTVSGSRPADVAAAQSAYAAANAAYQKLKAGPQAMDLAAAQAGLQSAEAALRQAQFAYDNAYRQNPAAIGASPAALALEQATNAYAAAKAIYDQAARTPDAAQLAAAAQAVDAARAALDRAVKPGSALDVAGAKAQLDAAVAQRDVFSSESANAPVALAQAQLQSVQAALELLTIRSPITGTVAKINVSAGEWAAPGQPVIVVSDLDRLQVETKDLSERDVAKVAIGQKVTVLVKAMAQEVSGRVKSVAPLAETIGGDVVYRAVIELDSRPAGLRPGMSVDVRFN